MNSSDFEKKWADTIAGTILKTFPDDFIQDNHYEIFPLPGKPLLKGSELFGTYEIIDTEGNQIVNSEDIDFIKYILYSNRTHPLNIKLLGNPALISDAVNRYEDHLDDIIKMISKDFNKEFPNSGKIENSISKIFRHLNLYRY